MSGNLHDEYKKCPNCKAIRFYVDNAEDGMVFFRVAQSGQIVSSQDPAHPLKVNNISHIYCTTCGWNGTIEELK